MKFKDSTFETKLELFIEYMNSFVLQIQIPSPQISVDLIDYIVIRERFNTRLLNKNMKMFYKFYRECICNYNEKLKSIFSDQFNIHQYNHHMISSQIIQYINAYGIDILDSFYKIITKQG